MIEICCLRDIIDAKDEKGISKELCERLKEDLAIIKDSCDEDMEYSLETFHTDYTGNGHIAILEGNESEYEIKNIGLTEGLDNTIPEAVVNYNFNGDKWTRAVVIYNDSFAMIFWLKNYDGFDSWEVVEKQCPSQEAAF